MTEIIRKYLLLIFILLILTNCKQNERKKKVYKLNSTGKIDAKSNFEKENDTIYNYWQIILDTTFVKKDFTYLGKNYKLILKTFSLNDSAIVRNLGRKYIDHSHTMISDLIILSDSLKIEKIFNRKDFEQSLNENFYKECNLFSTKIDSIIENQIFMTTELSIPDTDNQWKVEYSIRINKNKVDNMKITKTEYVGL